MSRMNGVSPALRTVAIGAALRGCQIFAGLNPHDLELIAETVEVRRLGAGEYLFHEGDPADGFYLVQKGAVNVHRVNPGGREQVIHVFRTGETFAEASLATRRGYPADARAEEDSQVLLIRRDGFLAVLKRQPEIALRILASMSLHLRTLVSQLDDLTLKDVESRLLHWLLKRCPAPGVAAPVDIIIPGTKRGLAQELGTVAETFSRKLSELKEQGLIEVHGRVIRVLSPPRLEEVLRRNLEG